jgi:DNA-directed RNA polymerase subunit RPC12/RpoP
MEEITLNIPYNFHLNTCPHCNMKFIIIAIMFLDNDDYSWITQSNTGRNGMFCPYCGKNSKDKK